jgi:hypothetical protein
MKSALAKLLTKDPVQSSTVVFRAGGNDVPILTRASGQSTAGYQTMGNSVGKTTLGAYRMGDQDGNAPASAIYEGDIFPAIPLNDRKYPEVTFSSSGNNVFQPEENSKATLALLKRLGDQKFKAKSQEPFDNYMAQQREIRRVHEASRTAGLEDTGKAREILRSIIAERRDQNEADYLRKMLDAGATAEGAQKEIENVRNANAIQEAKTVNDRAYQSKMLISRLAQLRGITPAVKEPLSQSSAISNPQPSQALATLMGSPGAGFGTSPLDVNRKTPDFYSRFLRKSNLTQEAGDEQTAFNQLLTSGEIPQPASGSYSLATLQGQERLNAINGESEALASRLESLRLRQNKIKLPLAEPVFAKEIIKRIYTRRNKKAGESVLTIPENIQDMTPTQLLLSINYNVSAHPNGLSKLKKELGSHTWGSAEKPSSTWVQSLKSVAYAMNNQNYISDVPTFPPEPFSTKTLLDEIMTLKNDSSTALKLEANKARVGLQSALESEGVKPAVKKSKLEKLGEEITQAVTEAQTEPVARKGKKKAKVIFPTETAEASTQVAGKKFKVKKPSAPAEPAPVVPDYNRLSLKELKKLMKDNGLIQKGNKPDLVKRAEIAGLKF